MIVVEPVSLFHERVDDIPLIIALAQQLGLPETLDRCLGNHGLQEGLSNGYLAVGWLAYILSEGDHRKYSVQEWANQHAHILAELFQRPIRPVDFADDRLGGVLRRLSKPQAWQAVETELWRTSLAVYDIECMSVRVDTTTACGHHTPTVEGVMQYSQHSKDHRPDLAQLKLVAAAAEPAGHLLATTVVPGQSADDPLYLPLIARVRAMVGRSGLLYVGDSKMAALATRAGITAHKDYYLMPLPLTGETGQQIGAWIDAVVSGEQVVTLCFDGDRLLGGGYEFERPLSEMVDGRLIEWKERVQIIRSQRLAWQQAESLEKRLKRAEEALGKLTPPPGKGKRQIREEAKLQAAITAVLVQHEVVGLLNVSWEKQERNIVRYIGPGRGGAQRPTQTKTQVRYVITAVARDPVALAQRQKRLGWRVQATTMPKEQMSLQDAVVHYRGGWCLEREFHLIKDRPLGISPLYVWRDDQIIGLTHLLTLALRLYSMIEMRVREGLAKEGKRLQGIYEGLPTHQTGRPTAPRILRLFARAQITLTCVEVGETKQWHITPLSPTLEKVLAYLGLPPSLYRRLAENST